MRVRLTTDCSGPNPKYDWSRPGESQREPCEIIREAGTVVEDPNAWILIQNGQAEPACDESRAWCDRHNRAYASRKAAVADVSIAETPETHEE